MKEEYIKRISRILAFIDENIDDNLSLEKMASIGAYSPFHLHRLFKSITHETLNSYITRKRIEKTAAILIHRKEITVAEIALNYGFNSNSSFTRAFKKFYGVSPTAFRFLNHGHYSKIGKTESKNGQSHQLFEDYICTINQLKNWMKMNANIEVKKLEDQHLAFVMQIGVEGIGGAFDRLLKWARPMGLLEEQNFKLIRIYHDSFKITAPEKVRMSIGILLAKPVTVTGEIGLTRIKAGKFIVGLFKIEPHDFEKAWSGLFNWMNENGYRKADQQPFEIYHNNYLEHPEKKCIVDLYIPVL